MRSLSALGPCGAAEPRRRAQSSQPPPAGQRRLAAVGTQPYLPRELARWQVTQSTSISRHAFEGPDVMRAYGRSLPR